MTHTPSGSRVMLLVSQSASPSLWATQNLGTRIALSQVVPVRRPHHVCFIPVSLASTRGVMPSFLPCSSPGGCSCDVPSRPSVWPLAPPPRHLSHLSHQSHACCIFHVVSVWAGGWGPGLGPSGWTDDWGLALALTLGHRETVRWGVGWGQVEQVPDGGVAAAPR